MHAIYWHALTRFVLVHEVLEQHVAAAVFDEHSVLPESRQREELCEASEERSEEGGRHAVVERVEAVDLEVALRSVERPDHVLHNICNLR